MNFLTNTLKKSIVYLLMTFMVTLTTHGTPFYGTITQTITNTNDPSFHVGQTVTGWYQYEASDVDGVFAANFWAPPPPGGTPALCGSIFSFVQHPTGGDGWLSLTGVISRFAEIAIEDSEVSDFRFSADYGYSQLSFRVSEFGASTRYLDRIADRWVNYNTIGTICFSDPVAAVPESAATASLATLSFAGIVLFRRRFLF